VFLNLENGPELILLVSGLRKDLATESQHQQHSEQSPDVIAKRKHAYIAQSFDSQSQQPIVLNPFDRTPHLSNVRGKKP
jgi:hypothetical protein